MSRAVLVTGGAGFIGSHLVRRLLEQGDRVRVLDDLSTGRRDRVPADAEMVVADLRDAAAVRRAVRGCEIVFHQGARPSVPRSFADPVSTTEIIAGGTLNVLLAAREEGVTRVVLASSSSVYGDEGELPRSESARPAPISPYATAKLAAEGFCASFSRQGEVETVALRYFNVFGPGQDAASSYAAVVPRFVAALAAGNPLTVYGDGLQSRDFTYVDDAVNANLLAADASGANGEVLNVSGGRPSTVLDVAEAIGARMGMSPLLEHLPPRSGEVRDSQADLSASRRLLGYVPQTSLEDGLGHTIEAMAAPPSNGHRSTGRRRPRRLVTGGAGFIGSHLVDALVARGDDVVVLDDLSTGTRDNLDGALSTRRVELVEGSILDESLVEDCVGGTDSTFHLAAAVGVRLILARPLDCLQRNVRGTELVVNAAARHGRAILFTSSSEVYGKGSGDALHEDSDRLLGPASRSRWVYADSKASGEHLARAHHADSGLPSVVARLFNTIGARQSAAHGMVLPRFVDQALAGADLTVHGDGSQTRCFCHVADTVAALLALSSSEAAAGGVYNVGSTSEISILALAERVIERLGSGSGIRFVPYEEAYGDGFEEPGRRRPDTAELQGLTGWLTLRTLDEAIDDVVRARGAEPVRGDASLAC